MWLEFLNIDIHLLIFMCVCVFSVGDEVIIPKTNIQHQVEQYVGIKAQTGTELDRSQHNVALLLCSKEGPGNTRVAVPEVASRQGTTCPKHTEASIMMFHLKPTGESLSFLSFLWGKILFRVKIRSKYVSEGTGVIMFH